MKIPQNGTINLHCHPGDKSDCTLDASGPELVYTPGINDVTGAYAFLMATRDLGSPSSRSARITEVGKR